MSIITIPLEISKGIDLEKGKVFDLGIKLARDDRYEICISNIHCTYENNTDTIYTLLCNVIDQTTYNPSGVIMRFTQSPVNIVKNWYILDSYDLEKLRLTLVGKGVTSIAVTLQLRKYG